MLLEILVPCSSSFTCFLYLIQSCALFQWHHWGGPRGGGSFRPRPQAHPAGEPQAAAAAAAAEMNCTNQVYDWSNLAWKHPGLKQAKSQLNWTEPNRIELSWIVPIYCAFWEKLHSIFTLKTLVKPTSLFRCTVCMYDVIVVVTALFNDNHFSPSGITT